MDKDQLIKLLRARLGTLKKGDSTYTQDQLVLFLEESARAFGMLPPVTFDDLDNEDFCGTFAPILLAYATYLALSSQALVERSREEAGMGQLLWEQAQFELAMWRDLATTLKRSGEFDYMREDGEIPDDDEDDEAEDDPQLNN